jgi:hypothetical protein
MWYALYAVTAAAAVAVDMSWALAALAQIPSSSSYMSSTSHWVVTFEKQHL